MVRWYYGIKVRWYDVTPSHHLFTKIAVRCTFFPTNTRRHCETGEAGRSNLSIPSGINLTSTDTSSHRHTITPSHHRTDTSSHHRTVAPSHHHTITPSHHHTITPSHRRTVAPSHRRTV